MTQKAPTDTIFLGDNDPCKEKVHKYRVTQVVYFVKIEGYKFFLGQEGCLKRSLLLELHVTVDPSN